MAIITYVFILSHVAEVLDAHRMSNGENRRFANNAAGHRAFMGWLGQPETVHNMRIVYEPTAPYHRAFERRLADVDCAPVKVNPRQARRFAEATASSPRPTGWMPPCWHAWGIARARSTAGA